MSSTKIQLWEIYISKNPHWVDGNITLTPAGLKKLVEQSYQQGYNHGTTVAGKVHENLRKAGVWADKPKDEYGDVFSDVFGDIFKGK